MMPTFEEIREFKSYTEYCQEKDFDPNFQYAHEIVKVIKNESDYTDSNNIIATYCYDWSIKRYFELTDDESNSN